VQCRDATLYTGITTDIKRRIKEHNTSLRGAKYTRSRGPVRLVYVHEYSDRSEASKAESRIKDLSRSEKIELIQSARREHMARRRQKAKESHTVYIRDKEAARALIQRDLDRVNKIYNYTYNRVAVRDQKTRWGSCSKNKNLNFNYKLLYVTEEERLYVIAHELCHLVEMNHSKAFWSLVARTHPNYKMLKAKLRARDMALL
jgi:predicted metal-dependent hydrolase